jgi:hypothetical protein
MPEKRQKLEGWPQKWRGKVVGMLIANSLSEGDGEQVLYTSD